MKGRNPRPHPQEDVPLLVLIVENEGERGIETEETIESIVIPIKSDIYYINFFPLSDAVGVGPTLHGAIDRVHILPARVDMDDDTAGHIPHPVSTTPMRRIEAVGGRRRAVGTRSHRSPHTRRRRRKKRALKMKIWR